MAKRKIGGEQLDIGDEDEEEGSDIDEDEGDEGEDDDEDERLSDIPEADPEDAEDPELAAYFVDRKPAATEKRKVNNPDGLRATLEGFRWQGVDWLRSLAVQTPTPEVNDVNDDLKREVAFHNQALEGAKRALRNLKDQGEPIRRPEDYYAEMVKSDDHMGRVKKRLLAEKKELERRQKRRQKVLMKRYGKQVKAERVKERNQAKKADMEAVEEWRKKQASSGQSETGLDEELRKAERRKSTPASRKKRALRDAKYGFGGPKGLKKQNDRASTLDMSSYKPANFDKGIKARGKDKMKPYSGSKGGKSKSKRKAARG